jgi:hypothetical protein
VVARSVPPPTPAAAGERPVAVRDHEAVQLRPGFLASLPERLVRSFAALVGGAVHETASLLLPRLVRRSRLYEATAKNALRIAIELVGGVDEARPTEPAALPARRLAVRKGAGNAVELGAIVAFGFSPLWLLAGASDVLHGSRVYLDALVGELRRARILAHGSRFETVDDLLGALEGASGGTARLIDIPPLALPELRQTLAELRGSAGSLPSSEELARLFTGLRNQATREQRSLLEVSSGIGLAFVVSARAVGSRHLSVPYREDWQPLRNEGFGAYARRVAGPYGRAVVTHFDPGQPSLTERGLTRLRGPGSAGGARSPS